MNFTEMDRVAAIWDDELTSILDIEKIGHRKRILLSLAGRDGIPHRFGKVKVKFKDKEKVAFLDTFSEYPNFNNVCLFFLSSPFLEENDWFFGVTEAKR